MQNVNSLQKQVRKVSKVHVLLSCISGMSFHLLAEGKKKLAAPYLDHQCGMYICTLYDNSDRFWFEVV